MERPLKTKEKSAKAGRYYHFTRSFRDRAPYISTKPRNAIKAALDTLFPYGDDLRGGSGKPLYPGFYGSIRALVGNRAAHETVRQWLKGRRGAPDWFVSVLRDRLVQRRAEIDQALAELDKLPERRGCGAGLRDWQREKKRRKIEEQTASERKQERERPLRGGL
jgi:hypothetical protein